MLALPLAGPRFAGSGRDGVTQPRHARAQCVDKCIFPRPRRARHNKKKTRAEQLHLSRLGQRALVPKGAGHHLVGRITKGLHAPFTEQFYVLTDWLLIRRAAQEITARLKGSKVRDAGQLADGRFALALWSHGETHLLCIDVFAPTPVVTLEAGELPISAEPGFVRSAAVALRATTLRRALAKKGDRMLRLEFAGRSRFGIASENAIVCELVPRFGNILLLKDETVVAAVKEFSHAQNRMRSVAAGDIYQPPPVNAGRYVPKLLADAFPGRGLEIVEELLTDDGISQPLFAYWEGGALKQIHLRALAQFDGLRCTREESILELFALDRVAHERSRESNTTEKRRRDLAKILADRAKKLETELARIAGRLDDSASREALRIQGENIYATLHEISISEREAAKELAAESFAAYKKAGAAREHLAVRQRLQQLQLESIQALQWELERVEDTHLEEMSRAIAELDQRAPSRQPAVKRRKRKPLQYESPHGSRIFVGRSPLENADLTFRVARPNDWWFHTQNIPGAHVILQRDDRAEPPEADLYAAASLAALHSKAKTSPKVAVDYTLRKHVRKRPASAPGLVLYTNAQSLYVEPGLDPILSEPHTPAN